MPQRNLHTFIPDEFIDLGEAGEHPIKFIAEIDNDVPFGYEVRVTIFEAKVAIHYITKNGSINQELNILPRLREFPSTIRKWEEAIRADWLMARTKEWERGA